MFYWLFTVVVIIVILIVFYAYNYYDKRSNIERNLERIKNKWGRPVNSRRNFKLIASYLNAVDDTAKVSPTFAEDLDLNGIFNYIDRTNSKLGKQFLYKKLFTPETSLEELQKLERKIAILSVPRPDLEMIEVDIADLNSTNAYYLAELFLRDHQVSLSPLFNLYARISGIAIVGLIISFFIVPLWVCFIALLVLISGNIALHYGTRTKISAYTRSLPQLITLHSVAKKLLKKVKFEQDEEIKQSLNKLSGLNRNLRLVNIESKVAGNPENLSFILYKFIKLLFLLEPLMFITSVKRINKLRWDIETVYKYVAEIDALIAIISVRAGASLLQ